MISFIFVWSLNLMPLLTLYFVFIHFPPILCFESTVPSSNIFSNLRVVVGVGRVIILVVVVFVFLLQELEPPSRAG